MKILVISNLYRPYIIGGYEMLAETVTNELRRRGHEVHIATGYGRALPPDGLVHGILDLDLDRNDETFLRGREPTIVDLLKWHLFSVRSYWNTRKLIRQLKPDLVSVWSLYLASQSPLVAAKHEGRPTVTYIADKWLCFGLKDIMGFGMPTTAWHIHVLQFVRAVIQPILFACVNPRNIITVSEFMRGFYLRYGFPAEAVSCIHSGVDTRRFTFERAISAPGTQLRLLYMSSLWSGKGPHVAVRALGKLTRKGHVNWVLDMYGEGTESFKTWLSSVIVEEGLIDHIHLHGFATQDDVISAYHSHDILIFPSIWDEPFASVPMEAMSCGLAVVATTAGGTPEAIVDGETGLLVPPDDPDALANSLERLMIDGQLRLALGDRAAHAARDRFDVHYWVDRLEQYYTTIVSTSVERTNKAQC